MFRFSYFSWIRSVLFSFMSGSGLSDLWPHFFVLCPAPVFRIYDPFEFRFVCFVSRSKVKKFDDQACPFFVHVRSFGSMTSPPPWTVYSDHSCPVSHHLVLFLFEFRFVCFVSRSKVKKIRWPSLSFFLSCPAPVFRIYDLPPPWTVYSDHSCPPVSHHLVLFPFEFRFVCFVSRSKVKKFDDQACPFFVHVRLRSFRSMNPPPPTPPDPCEVKWMWIYSIRLQHI